MVANNMKQGRNTSAPMSSRVRATRSLTKHGQKGAGVTKKFPQGQDGFGNY